MGGFSCIIRVMNQIWTPETPDELRRHAGKLEAIAAHVRRQDVASHLREQAALLLAQAELRAIAAHE